MSGRPDGVRPRRAGRHGALLAVALATALAPARVRSQPALPAPGDEALARQLGAIGDARGARAEWERALAWAASDSQRAALHLELARAATDAEAVTGHYRAARLLAQPAGAQDEVVFEEAVRRLAAGETAGASQLFEDLGASASDAALRTEAAWWSGLCALHTGAWSRAREAFRASGLYTSAQQARIDSLLARPPVRSRSATLARRLSLALPGLGFAYAGDAWGALTGAAVNALTIGTALDAALDGSPAQAVYVTVFWVSRYYFGSSSHAGATAERRNQADIDRFAARAERLVREELRRDD